MDLYTKENKFVKKIQNNPFMPIGILGLMAACGIGAYKYKHRGKMSTSLFLLQLRVTAQGMVVGSLAIGVLYTLVNEHILTKK